jgi:hypothetical protein
MVRLYRKDPIFFKDPAMKTIRHWVWIVLFGALFGLNEVLVGEAFPGRLPLLASLWLPAWAFLVLATARGLWNRPGSSLMIGATACIFRALNAAPFFCHLLGVFLLAVAFDAMASLLLRRKEKLPLRCALTGAAGIYLGRALFAVLLAYVIRYRFWAEAGASRVLDHVFVTGSLAALAAAFAVPLGYWLGRNFKTLSERKPRFAFRGALAAAVVLWVVGGVV